MHPCKRGTRSEIGMGVNFRDLILAYLCCRLVMAWTSGLLIIHRSVKMSLQHEIGMYYMEDGKITGRRA